MNQLRCSPFSIQVFLLRRVPRAWLSCANRLPSFVVLYFGTSSRPYLARFLHNRAIILWQSP